MTYICNHIKVMNKSYSGSNLKTSCFLIYRFAVGNIFGKRPRYMLMIGMVLVMTITNGHNHKNHCHRHRHNHHPQYQHQPMSCLKSIYRKIRIYMAISRLLPFLKQFFEELLFWAFDEIVGYIPNPGLQPTKIQVAEKNRSKQNYEHRPIFWAWPTHVRVRGWNARAESINSLGS